MPGTPGQGAQKLRPLIMKWNYTNFIQTFELIEIDLFMAFSEAIAAFKRFYELMLLVARRRAVG
ncbi:hypothetical protein [Pseudomonas sp. NBRC 111119]|uniref:hypothetical protein n=1 Tax=Pseudomonas sp. NBRC 111119 TaxID=1661034 RepID=UPI00076191FB|nr:hypothetical protein [Pseudomonas sp. NBRC 111119]